MISIQAEQMAQFFASITERISKTEADLATIRDVYETLHLAASEPEGVSYAEIDADGVPALWCIPHGCVADRVLLHSHGGGTVIFSMHLDRKAAGHLAKSAGVRALVLDYRRSPEHKFPAQIDDLERAYQWLVAQGIHPEKIALTGQSIGGNLAVSLAIALRNKRAALPAAILSISPWYDLELKNETIESNAKTDKLLSRHVLEWFRETWLGGTGVACNDPRVNLLYADLTGLPPINVYYGDHELFVGEAIAFANRAKDAGVDVSLISVPAGQHNFILGAGRVPEVDEAVEKMGRWLRSKLWQGATEVREGTRMSIMKSSDAAKAVVRQNTEEVQGRGNFEVFEKLFADDFVDHTPQPNMTPDKAGVRQLYRYIRDAFPDFHAEIHWQLADGDRVTTYKTYYGTHEGTLFSVAPTHRKIHFESVDVMRVRDGKITDHWGVGNLLSLMRQIGGWTPPAEAEVSDLGALFDGHIAREFADFDVDATMETMVPEPYVHCVPAMTGGVGGQGVRQFYSEHFINQIPKDAKVTPISRTIGKDQVVDEFILSFTHDTQWDYLLPGIPPTGKRVELPHVVVMKFENGKVAHEHIWWDQATLLVQVGLLDPANLPVVSVEQARKLLRVAQGHADHLKASSTDD